MDKYTDRPAVDYFLLCYLYCLNRTITSTETMSKMLPNLILEMCFHIKLHHFGGIKEIDV